MPVTRELVEYIKNCLKQGYRENNIRSILKIYDWTEKDINDAFRIAKEELKNEPISSPKQTRPIINTKPPQSPHMEIKKTTQSGQKLKSNIQIQKQEVKRKNEELNNVNEGRKIVKESVNESFQLSNISDFFSEPKARVVVFVFGVILIIGLISFLAFPKQPKLESESDFEFTQEYSPTPEGNMPNNYQQENYNSNEQSFDNENHFEEDYMNNESTYENQSSETQTEENFSYENESYQNDSENVTNEINVSNMNNNESANIYNEEMNENITNSNESETNETSSVFEETNNETEPLVEIILNSTIDDGENNIDESSNLETNQTTFVW